MRTQITRPTSSSATYRSVGDHESSAVATATSDRRGAPRPPGHARRQARMRRRVSVATASAGPEPCSASLPSTISAERSCAKDKFLIPSAAHHRMPPRSISSRLRRSSTPLDRLAMSSWDNHSPAVKLNRLVPRAIRTGCFCCFDPEPGFFSPSVARLSLSKASRMATPRQDQNRVRPACHQRSVPCGRGTNFWG